MSTYDLNVYVEAIVNARVKVEEEQDSQDYSNQHHAVDLVAWALAELIANDNPHFDAVEFFRATSTVPPSKES